jgi:hypothetical protein
LYDQNNPLNILSLSPSQPNRTTDVWVRQ